MVVDGHVQNPGPEPDKFKPGRFLEESKEEDNLNAYRPFGLGPRMCIDNRFICVIGNKNYVFSSSDSALPAKTVREDFVIIKVTEKRILNRLENDFWLSILPRKAASYYEQKLNISEIR
ncbi:hypothetical protein P5V15_005781 [Pogonomyrmex californicus]